MKLVIALIAAVIALAAPALADDYPNRPIRVFTTSSAGGISDIFMRVLNDALQSRLGQPLIVENKPGGAGNIAGARLPGRGAGRLHHLHHQCRHDDL